MYWCHINRDLLLNALPMRAVVAEVGTYSGEFAVKIALQCTPSKLFLIDKWDYTDAGYLPQTASYESRDGQRVYSDACRRFAPGIASGAVQLIRADSLSAASTFPPGTFDWVYIDADHRYEAVRADLAAWSRLLKPDGLLLGHDFEERDFEPVADLNLGVADAVRDFVRGSDFKFLLMTGDFHATYCLTRNPLGEAANLVLSRIMYTGAAVLEMGDIDKIRFHGDRWMFNGKPLYFRRVEHLR